MVRIGDVEFPDPSQRLYLRSEETVSQVLEKTLLVEDSFICHRQVDGSPRSLYGDNGVYLFILPVIR